MSNPAAAAETPASEAKPALSPMMAKLQGRLPSGAMEMLKSKAPAAAGAAGESDKEKEQAAGAAAASTDDKGKAGAEEGGQTDDGSIDLSELGGEDKGEKTDEDPKPEDEAELNKLDAAGLKKRLEDKNKENTKIRKRAQEAEAKAAQLQKDLEAAQAGKGGASVVVSDGGPLARFDAEHLDLLEQDVAGVRALLKQMSKDPDAEVKYKSKLDGQEYTLEPQHVDWVLEMQDNIQARRKHLAVQGEAQTEADKISKSLEKLPGYKDTLATLREDKDYLAKRPLLEADAALGRLAREGGYVLVKKDKAAAAKSAASPGPGSQQEAATPKAELPSSMPQVARSEGGNKPDVSAAHGRAMTTGSLKDIRASIAAKTRKAATA